MTYWVCKVCGRSSFSDAKIVICSVCNSRMEIKAYQPSVPVEIKNPYPTTIYGEVIPDEKESGRGSETD